ncbi:ABC transporter substrate-binding protein [Allostreptomyces psammosilenae]|uniref:Peptide/nickel transport system substrate-binding protein n=1 Tax=Allostreptomyces psammosilenae TaxID=1892865 RepID=A0A852ZPL7_9ACTN|nr:ABC transporter substrate-binding protein [Allostreptomyces psammosilenae]NYI04333.1 peptide/nickel transport system substrate-binding protein [Allostreptomyces psammosilenae]
MRATVPIRRRPTGRTPRRVGRLSAALLALVALLTACTSSTGGQTPGEAASAGPPVSGGRLRYALSIAPVCPDPQQASMNMAVYIARQVVDSLTDQDPETGEIVPWLAESWEVSADAREFTFHLRDGVTFSDGTPLTAESVKRNFDTIVGELGAAAPLAGNYLAGYQETRVEDELTATVVFDRPNAQFLQASSTFSLGIVADATLRTPAAERCQGEVIGSGPFVFDRYVQDQEVVLARREGYAWGSAAFGHQGEAYLDAIDFRIIPESGVRAGSLASGQIDASSDVLPQDEPQILAAGGSVLTTANPGVVFNLQTNVSRGPLSDARVRQALQVGINRQEVVDTVLGEHFNPATSVLGGKTPGWTDLSHLLSYDPDAAGRLLDEAGWIPGPDGIRVRDGEPLAVDVVFSAVFNGSQAALELVQQQLRAIGVDLRLRLVTPAESAEIDANGDYDTYYYNSTRADPDVLRLQFSSTLTNRNHREPDDRLDPVLEQQLAATDEAERAELVAEAQRLIIENGWSIPLFELSQAIGVAPHVHGLAFEASARLQFYDTWISAD